MSDPLLSAVKALREATTGEESGAGRYTRARVLAAVRQQKRRRVLHVTFGIPLAAILVGSGAWAASGQSLPSFVQRVSAALGLRESPVPPSTSASPKLAKRSATKPTPSAIVAATDATSAAEASVEAPPDRVAPSVVPASVTAVQPLLPVAKAAVSSQIRATPARDSQVTEQELSLYEAAHRAHFAEKNPSAALRAWSEYLRQMPRGRFALEASYNRALCLLRLGLNDEARRALVPFAGGAHGGYRKAEAQALLEQLEPTSP